MDGEESGGRAPVVIVRPTTNVTSGVAVTQKLVRAAVAFGDLIRGTYGPNGLDKMLYKSNGETAVTNDGARIVADLLVKHPAAKTFVSMAETQENASGDGVTGCLIFAGELMREGGRLLERSLHPLTLVEGYREAADITLATAARRSVDASSADEARWLDVALTAMTGTSAEAGGAELAALVVDAALLVQRTAQGNPLSYERIRMAKRGAGALGDSRLINGIILDQRVALDRQPRHLEQVKVAVLTRPLALQKGFVRPKLKSTTWTNSSPSWPPRMRFLTRMHKRSSPLVRASSSVQRRLSPASSTALSTRAASCWPTWSGTGLRTSPK